MNQIRMIALDLDGTVLHTDGTLSPVVESAIRQAIEEGVIIAIASGRPYNSLPESITKIEGISYAVVSNGAAVYDMKTKRRIWSKPLSAKAVSQILNASEKYGYIMELFLDGKAYAEEDYIANPARFGRSPQFIRYVQSTRIPVRDLRLFVKENKNRFDSIAFICPDPAEKCVFMQRLKNEISGVYVTTSGGDLIELMHQDTGKAAGLAFLAETCNLSAENMAAFGNGDNDADMLRYAGVGIAVENASKLCRESSDVLVKSNEEDGVADGIRMLLKK